MKHLLSLLLLCLAASPGWAQPVTTPDRAPPQATPEQRRAALRSILQAQQRSELPPKDNRRARLPPERRLSELERADLREQLRQQRLDGRPERR